MDFDLSKTSKRFKNPKLTHFDNSLFIIGNGFDLYCGLRTDFKSFLETEEFKYLAYYKKSEIANAKSTPFFTNFFIGYFYSQKEKNKNWADVESSLAYFFKYCMKDYLLAFNSNISIVDNECPTIYYGFKEKRFFNKNSYSKSFQEWLFEELYSFEYYFSEYLIKHCNTCCQDEAAELFRKINESNISTGTILDFNYTNFLNLHNFRVNHVHGDLKNHNIIIGFDGYKADLDDSLDYEWSYTKTFRILNLPYKGEFGLDDKIDRIIFYGHSLGENDYSYFQAIFDFYHIYESNVILEFCYTDYDNKQNYKVKQNIRKLISDYGRTLNNKDHGKNLLHKLMIEGRIIVREIPGS